MAISYDRSYRKKFTINGSSDGAQTNYQMLLHLYYGSGTDGTEAYGAFTIGKVYCNSHCKADFSDIRITKSDGETLLDYWIESKTDGSNAYIWIEFDSIPASPDTVDFYLYYGNSLASAYSNMANTFPFADHFDGDKSKWTGDTDYLTISGSRGQFKGPGANWKSILGTVLSASSTFALRCKGKMPASGSQGFGGYGTSGGETRMGYGIGSTPVCKVLSSKDGTTTGWSSETNWTADADKTWDLIRRSGVNMSAFEDGQQLTYSPYASYPSTDTQKFGMQAYFSDKILDFDWVLIRKYTTNEPTWGNWGNEQLLTHDGTIHDILTVDQSQTSTSTEQKLRETTSNAYVAQSFTPAYSKEITQVKLKLKRVGSPSGFIWVEIRDIATGYEYPSDAPKTFGADSKQAISGKIDVSQISNADGGTTYDFILPKGIKLNKDTVYAIVLNADYSINSSNYIAVREADTNPYSGGKKWVGTTGGGWSGYTNYDLYFCTYYGESNALPLDQLPPGVGSPTFTNLTTTSNVIEGTRAQFFAYRTTAFDITNTNTWYDYPWNVAATVKQGFTHDHAGANPEQITVSNSGTYLIDIYLSSPQGAAETIWNFRLLDDGVEIPGSWGFQRAYYQASISKSIIAKIAAGSILELQVGTHVAGLDIAYLDTATMPDATKFVAASISITKLSND